MAKNMKKTGFATETDRILLECLANIQKSIRDYQRDIKDALEDTKFSLLIEND